MAKKGFFLRIDKPTKMDAFKRHLDIFNVESRKIVEND